MKVRLQKLIEKIKTNKKIQIMLLSLLVCVILLVYVAYFVIGTEEEVTKEENKGEVSSTTEYVSMLEDKLENVLSNIEGAGKVKVAITISSDFVYEYAYQEEDKSNLLLVNDEPVIVSKIYPQILGVLIVAEGGDNFQVKLDILSSVQTLISVANENITILNGEF